MSERPSETGGELSEPFGTKDLLQLVAKKLSSQALLFGLAMVVIVVVTGLLFQKRPDSGIPIILLALFVFVVVLVSYLFVEQKAKLDRCDPNTANQVLRQQLGGIANSSESFAVRVWTTPEAEGGSRDLQVISSGANPSYRVGEKVTVHFSTTRDCYVTLLNIGTSGRLAVLFPNARHRDNFVSSGREYTIPGPDYGFEYSIAGPPGVEKLKVIATLQKVELLETNFSSDGSFFRIVDARDGARDIITIKKKVDTFSASEWAEAGHEFRTA